MPLPSDEKLIQLSRDLIDAFRNIFGKHPGFRPTHARGILIRGTFEPSSAAKDLSLAPHFDSVSTSITVRFSSSTGLPQIPDTDPNGNPRGLAIRFHLGEHVHTDVISHSTPLFPTRTGDEFLGMLRAIAASPPGTASPSPIEQFLGAHPAAFAFVTAPKPTPASYVLETYYGINAMKATNASGETKYFRYRVVPLAGEKVLTEEELAQKDAGFLHEELLARLGGGGDEVVLKLYAQIANEGDVIDDATVQWPESRNLVELGAIKLESAVEENEKEQKHIIFDPVPRVEGLEPSKDPLLELRAALYLISGRERRAA